MFGKVKKPISLAYKEKLLSDIAYYEKRIDEALHKKKYNTSEDLSPDEDSNPYKVAAGPFPPQLKREESRLSDCTSMTLELAMLTIMQSEVNVLAAAPEVRLPVLEDGTWQEVAAECKIDLVSFNITFYAHKPHRKFAPTRFRNLQVSLTKPAHQKELAQSVLAKLTRPNLALQVLQSYATAFRSRRTTLLELAEKYTDRLKMEAMPEGGYRVKFLELLTVEWTLENMWSPVVPFCHRMKFEVEYMPKHYIHAIGKLYKQFKDPSLETSERTDVLAKIFDICLEAQGPARDLQDTFESDPETAGRLHERRTTIDQELEVPSKCDHNVQISPQKLSKGKENKGQNRKTAMAPPKTLPKKAKKVANVNNKDKKAVDEDNVSKSSKNSDKKSSNDATKTCNDNNVTENRKAAKRPIESDATGNAKKIRTDNKNDKLPEKVAENDEESNEPNVSSKSNIRNKDGKAASNIAGDKNADINSKNKNNIDVGKNVNLKNFDKRNEAGAKNKTKTVENDINNIKRKEIDTDVGSKKEAKEIRDAGSVASSKTSVKKTANTGNHVASAKEQGTDASVSLKKSKKGVDGKSTVSSKNKNEKGEVKEGSSNKNRNAYNNKNEASKNSTDTMSSGNFINKNKSDKDSNKNEKNKHEVVERNKAINANKIQKGNEKEKLAKALDKDKVIHKRSVDSNKVSKQNENTEKSVKTKQNIDKVASKSSDNNKETIPDAASNKVSKANNTENKSSHNTKTVENDTQKIKGNKDSVSKKIAKTNTEVNKNMKNDINNQKATTVVEKSKTVVSKASNADVNKNDATTSVPINRVEKVINNKVAPKPTINNIKNQNKDKADQLRNINAKTVPGITKSNIIKANINIESTNLQKIKEKQTKVVEKLKTRIPMMKNKLKIGTFNDNTGKIDVKSGKNVEKTKIPLKSLPVFKKIVRPTRMSPRKLPTAVKPSSHGFLIK